MVTSVGPDGQPVGTTANAVSSLSLDPPLILVCFDRASLTLEAIRSHGAFVVNVLATPQRELAVNFALRGVEAIWEGVEHGLGPTGSPRLEGVLATLECTVEHSLPGGDPPRSLSGASGTRRLRLRTPPRCSSGAAPTSPSTRPKRPPPQAPPPHESQGWAPAEGWSRSVATLPPIVRKSRHESEAEGPLYTRAVRMMPWGSTADRIAARRD